MKKLLLCVLVFVFTYSFAFAEDIKLKKVSGYGETQEAALKNAFDTAVQQAVGVVVTTRSIVNNGKLIDEIIHTKSKGYIKQFDIVAPYDGEKIVIEALISKELIIKEFNITPSHEIEYDGQEALAIAYSRQRFFDAAISEMPMVAEEIALELSRTVEVQIISRKPEIMIRDGEVIFDMKLAQEINLVKYSSIIKRLDQQFRDMNAEVSKFALNPSRISLKNAIVLIDIDGTVTTYTFTDKAFKAANSLYKELNKLNDNPYTELIFFDRDKRVVTKVSKPNYIEYFLVYNQLNNGSFAISPNIEGKHQDTNFSGTIPSEKLAETAYVVAENNFYSEQSSDPKKAAIKKMQKPQKSYSKNSEAINNIYISANIGLYQFDDSIGSSIYYDSFGFSFEGAYYFNDYLGLGVFYNEASAKSDDIEFTWLNSFEQEFEIKTTSIGLKGYVKIPFRIFEPFAAIGLGYNMSKLEYSESYDRDPSKNYSKSYDVKSPLVTFELGCFIKFEPMFFITSVEFLNTGKNTTIGTQDGSFSFDTSHSAFKLGFGVLF